MTDSIEHQLTELGLQLNDVKHRIAECERKAAAASTEDKVKLEGEKVALESREMAILEAMRELQARRLGE